MFFEQFSYYDNDNTHGKLVGNAQRNARPKDNDCSQWQQTGESEAKREFQFHREREQSREQESAAPEFETAAPATMRMGEQSRVQNKAHTGHTPRGVNRQQRAERETEWESKIYIGQLPTLTHKRTLTCTCLLCWNEARMKCSETNGQHKMCATKWKQALENKQNI